MEICKERGQEVRDKTDICFGNGHPGGDEEKQTFLTMEEGNNNKDTVINVTDKTTNEKTDTNHDPPYDDFDDDNDGDDDDDDKSNILSSIVDTIQNGVRRSFTKLDEIAKGHLLKAVLLLAYFAYIVVAIFHRHEGEDFWRLIGCTLFGIFMATRFRLARSLRRLFVKIYGAETLTKSARMKTIRMRVYIRWLMYAGLMAVIVYVVFSATDDINKLRSIPGFIFILVVCLLMSNNPKKINWHTVYVSLGMQFVCALVFLKWSIGRLTLSWIQDRLNEFFSNSKAGSLFLFGESYTDHYIIFGAFPIILLMGSVVAVFYYLGVMQLVVRWVGSFLCFLLDVGPVEATSVAAGIFLEGVIAILSLKPFLLSLTKSELFVVLTSTFSSLGGAYLGVLVSMEVPLEYLLTAMVISAPATFTVCKLVFPETKTKKKDQNICLQDFDTQTHNTIFEAIESGGISMLNLLGNIVSTIFVFLTLISWTESTFTWFGERVGVQGFTMSSMFAYLLYPIPLILGIDFKDCKQIATLWGYRLSSTNIISFLKMLDMRANRHAIEEYQFQTNYTGNITFFDNGIISLDLWNKTLTGGVVSERSEAIGTYSLCGFSGVLSVGITIGIFYTLLPERKQWISGVPFRAMVAGNIANLMSGCLASFFY